MDLNNSAAGELADKLREPLLQASVALSEEELQDVVKNVEAFRASKGGLLNSFDQLNGVTGVSPQILQAIKQQCALGPFTILSADVVGPKIGKDLQRQAILATLYALGGMLVYIAFRFEWIYGVAAVIAVFHDTIITIGLFSLFNYQISLTVVAALLDAGWLFDERHHCGVRPHPRKPEAGAARVAHQYHQSERESDAEPDHSDQWINVFDGDLAVFVRGPSAA